jgi:uncharacterized protein (DUF433 family)
MPQKKTKQFDRIAVDPKIMVGKPVIKGTRIPVAVILNLLAHGYTHARIRKAYKQLKEKDIQAAVAYAAILSNFEEHAYA